MESSKSQIAAVLTSIAALVAAVGAYQHQPEDAAKASYIELTQVISAMQETQRENHEDLTALRAYVDTYVRSHESLVTPVSPPAGASPSPAHAPSSPALPAPGVVERVLSVASPATPTPPPVKAQRAPPPPRAAADFAW